MKKLSLLFFILLWSVPAFSQRVPVEVGIIESFVYDKNPDTLVLTFSTDIYCKATAVIKNGGKFVISDTLTDFHHREVALSKEVRTADRGYFYLILTGEDGIVDTSEMFDFENYKDTTIEVVSETGAGLTSCITGGAIYLVPSFYNHTEGGTQTRGIGKEFPIVSFFSGGFNYPVSYLMVEYRYLLKTKPAHQLSAGWKYMWQPPTVDFISPGVFLFTDFLGNNGAGAEVSLGLFKFFDVYTVYTKFRYNRSFAASKREFTDISVGLYSSFFSLHK